MIVREAPGGQFLVDLEWLQAMYPHLSARTIHNRMTPVACCAERPPVRRGRTTRIALYDAYEADRTLKNIRPNVARRRHAQQARRLRPVAAGAL